MADIAVCW